MLEELVKFIKEREKEVYPEPSTQAHTGLTRHMIEVTLKRLGMKKGGRVLDVGCGQGVALDMFKDNGFEPIGISLSEIDVQKCKEKDLDARLMDQSLLEFGDDIFNLIWCRHCLEHSIFPYFTLSGFNRVLKPGGYFYIEVPAPDTASAHQTNKNHYSVMGASMWEELIKRSGFFLLDKFNIDLKTKYGDDSYFAFTGGK